MVGKPIVPASFGIHVGGPIETNLGGKGIATLWPAWAPVSMRMLNVWGGVPPTYSYKQGVSNWSAVETASGTFDWSLFDLVWAKLIAQGVTDVLFGFNAIPSWAYNAGTFDLAAVGAWVAAYLTRAKANGLAIKFVEGINEADVPNSWGVDVNGNPFGGTTQDQVNIQKAIYAAAKAFDPTILVVSPPYNSLQAAALYFGAFLDAGGGQYCDVIAFHGYPDTQITSPFSYQKHWQQFSEMLNAKGQGGKPVWNTEFNGTGNGNIPAMVAWIGWSAFLDLSNGVARRFVYSWDAAGYELWDATTPPSGTVNAAGVAYQQLLNWLSGVTVQPPSYVRGLWTCAISKSGYQGLAVWTDDGSAMDYNPPGWAKQSRDLAGNVTPNLPKKVKVGGNVILFES